MECCLFENCKYTFDFIMQHFYIIPIGTKIRNTKGDIYELRESQENGKIVRKFSRINGTKLRFLTYNNIKETFWLIKEELLTEEEKEFLRKALKFGNYGSDTENGTVKFIIKNGYFIELYYEDWAFNTIYIDKKLYFKNLEQDKQYTLKELGLEEK